MGTAGAWNFGETGYVPALAYADYDGPGVGYSCDDYPDEIPTETIPTWNAEIIMPPCGEHQTHTRYHPG